MKPSKTEIAPPESCLTCNYNARYLQEVLDGWVCDLCGTTEGCMRYIGPQDENEQLACLECVMKPSKTEIATAIMCIVVSLYLAFVVGWQRGHRAGSSAVKRAMEARR